MPRSEPSVADLMVVADLARHLLDLRHRLSLVLVAEDWELAVALEQRCLALAKALTALERRPERPMVDGKPVERRRTSPHWGCSE